MSAWPCPGSRWPLPGNETLHQSWDGSLSPCPWSGRDRTERQGDHSSPYEVLLYPTPDGAPAHATCVFATLTPMTPALVGIPLAKSGRPGSIVGKNGPSGCISGGRLSRPRCGSPSPRPSQNGRAFGPRPTRWPASDHRVSSVGHRRRCSRLFGPAQHSDSDNTGKEEKPAFGES